MRYVALIRGINVGGANQVSMAALARAFAAAGMSAVRTYINSGNVLFGTDLADRSRLAVLLQQAIQERTGTSTDVHLRDEEELAAVVAAIPAGWTNDAAMKCDVVFLPPDVDGAALLAELGPRPGIEDARHVRGAVVWRVDRKDATRSRLTRLVGTPLYARVTVRNCNTVRKLLALLRQ